ncbi:MAG: ATP-binding cassette domain-containing protein [Gammaproteobacteria bacterium]|nr:ATP-binding cassette domain-containing protein [Gammaproteobacteria bacterium]
MLLQLNQIHLSIGHPPLLASIDWQIRSGERTALVGRNGAGKSTLLKIIAGLITPDDGRIIKSNGLRISWLAQEVPTKLEGTIRAVVAEGFGAVGAWRERYQELVCKTPLTNADADELEQLQGDLDANDGWRLEQRLDAMLDRLDLDPDARVESLSGGFKRRVLLAQALINQPNLLLLDEPTNHLDIQQIDWLEKFLLDFNGSVVFISHDRALVRRLATNIVELERGGITHWPGDYDRYLTGKMAALEEEERRDALFDKRLAAEEVWIRQGIKARRTRNEGRVRALEAMRRERAERRERTGNVNLKVDASNRSGQLVIEALGLRHGYGGRQLLNGFSTVIQRGDKIGILGPNGCGKTTLINLLLGEITPDAGTVRHGTRLEIAYYDQLRETLDEDATLMDVVAQGRTSITINGQEQSVMGYLGEFLFSPRQTRGPVRALSGGERNRLLLARLFTRPANFLVLDEPTNDLDTETLEILESLLTNYAGTLLLVSHDRAFLDNVVTSLIAFDPDGEVREYVGGYSDYLRQRPAPPSRENVPRDASPPPPTASPPPAKVKLNHKERQELDAIPARIDALENEHRQLLETMSQPGFYSRPAADITAANTRTAQIQHELETIVERWEVLEQRA